MVRVHQHLYNVGDASALAAPAYVRELGEQIQRAYGREGIALAVDSRTSPFASIPRCLSA